MFIDDLITDTPPRDISSKKRIRNVEFQTPRQTNCEYNRLPRWSVVLNIGKNEDIKIGIK